MIFKVIAFALIGVFAVVALRQVKPELALFAGLATGLVIIFTITEELIPVLDVFQNLSAVGGIINNALFASIIKIIGIGYLTEYAASLCDDYANASIGKHVQLAGKVAIFTMAIPIIVNIIESKASLIS